METLIIQIDSLMTRRNTLMLSPLQIRGNDSELLLLVNAILLLLCTENSYIFDKWNKRVIPGVADSYVDIQYML